MTEAGWRSASDPKLLVTFLGTGLRDRKWRLFACACCYRVYTKDEDGSSWWCVEVAERFADNQASLAELQEAEEEMDSGDYRYSPADYAVSPDIEAVLGALDATLWTVESEAKYRNRDVATARAEEQSVQAVLLRDIFGNPFRPIDFSPEWRTDTAVALAHGMYESRDFGAMPILADALQDIGCDSADVLDHCRGEGPHVRGCWVVDLVLGKE